MFLLNPRHKTRHILKGNQRNIERIAKPHEPRALYACIDIQHPGKKRRLVCHNPHRPPRHASKSNDNIPRKAFMHLKEIPIVDDVPNHIHHVIGLRKKISVSPASETTPSCIRAPPESFNPTSGAPTRIAMSIIFTIFAAFASESDPPNTVKSCANTNTTRPCTRP